MLAVRRRARRAASRRNGQPTQNCTGVASTSAVSRPQGCSIAPPGAMASATRATASGTATSNRRRQPASAFASASAFSPSPAGLMR